MSHQKPCCSRDVESLTVSEIDRLHDDESEIEDYSSGVSYRPSDVSDDSDIDLGDINSANVSQTSDNDSPSRSLTTNTVSVLPSIRVWNEMPQMKTFLFSNPTGLRIPIPVNNEPLEYFNMVIDDIFLESVARETNQYAEQVFLSESTTENSRICQWKPLNLIELKTFLGLLFHTGVVKMPTFQHYWRTDKLFRTCFGEYMSRDRFLIILRCLHFSKEDPMSTDRLHKIRPVVDYFNSKMDNIYLPGKELSLDESMVLWRGRLVFRQFIKNKRHKYGIKLYMLTEPNGLIQKFCVYAGAMDQLSGVGHTEKVVLHLLSERLGKAHSVYVDNFYNSVPLASNLLNHKTYITGTLRIDRKENPTEVVKKTLKKGETYAQYSNGVMVGKWRDVRQVLYISNQYENEMSVATNKRGVDKSKPLPIICYNEFMSGIDRQDQLMSYYPSERKTVRWYKKLFIHIIQMGILNAYLLYNKYNIGGKMSMLDFRIKIIEGLLTPLEKQTKPVRNTGVDDHMPTKAPVGPNGRVRRRRCIYCYQKGTRKDTTYQCEACPEVPALCLGNCFQAYHKK